MIRGWIRSKAFWAAGTLSVAAFLYLAFAVFGVQAAFTNEEVNEDFAVEADPVAEQATSQEDATSTDDAAPQPDASPSTREEQPAASEEPSGEPLSGPVRVSFGQFRSVAHEGEGEAIVYRMEDGSHVLRLENLAVDNGPDLFVYAVAAEEAFDEATVLDAGFVNAGRLKGNRGNQTYELPPEFDPEVHRAVSIWCQRFTVNFAAAPLEPAG